ncbi:MAG: Rossmann-like and DUF2520 domain-containing protein [Balneolales bacterium]
MIRNHQISVIGTGAVGSALARSLHEKGIFISGLYNRTKSVADQLAGDVDAETTGAFPGSLEFLGTICFICVPDDGLPEIVERLSALEGVFSKVSFVHTSGAKPASLLMPLQKRGSETASLHPLQTFDGTSNTNIFKSTYISLQGDHNLVHELQHLVDILGARYLVVDEQQKAGLHLSAVFACNYLAALMEAAQKSLNLNEPGIDVIKVMGPLISKTWENITRNGVDHSLTGPISRGDAGTIQKHLTLLEESPQLSNLYRQLGSLALEIAERKGLDQDKIKRIQHILDDSKT